MGLFFVGIGWDGSQVHGDGMRQKKIIWGQGGNGADFHYRVTLYRVSGISYANSQYSRLA